MKTATGLAVAALTCLAGAAPFAGASAADLAAPGPAFQAAAPSLFDVAFGMAGVTDYRFRGISNSAKDPAVQGYVELQAFDWVYAGVWASSVSFPAPWERSGRGAEFDIYGGLRHGFGSLTLDVGGLYYGYAGAEVSAPRPGRRRHVDYWELYAKPTIAVGDHGAVSGNLFWTTDFMNLGGDALYLSVIPKLGVPVAALPEFGFYVSGELGKQWIGASTALPVKFDWKDYVAWNVGGGVTYKAMTLDIRYSDTSLSRRDCAFNYGGRSLCGDAVVAKLSFDTALSQLK